MWGNMPSDILYQVDISPELDRRVAEVQRKFRFNRSEFCRIAIEKLASELESVDPPWVKTGAEAAQ